MNNDTRHECRTMVNNAIDNIRHKHGVDNVSRKTAANEVVVILERLTGQIDVAKWAYMIEYARGIAGYATQSTPEYC